MRQMSPPPRLPWQVQSGYRVSLGTLRSRCQDRISQEENECLSENKTKQNRGGGAGKAGRVVRMPANRSQEKERLREGLVDVSHTTAQSRNGLAKPRTGSPGAKVGCQRNPTCLPGPGQPQLIAALVTGGSTMGVWPTGKPRGGWILTHSSWAQGSARSLHTAPGQRETFLKPLTLNGRLLFFYQKSLVYKRTNLTLFGNNINSVTVNRIGPWRKHSESQFLEKEQV